MLRANESSGRRASEAEPARPGVLAAVAVQTGIEAQLIPVPSPAVPQTIEPSRGLVVAILVLILGLLLASTPVRNSDFWLHLATGKSLVEGTEASFSYLQDTPWIHHGWLYHSTRRRHLSRFC